MSSKCPKCEKVLVGLNLESCVASVPFGGGQYNAIMLSCPYCSAVVSAQIDPIALRTDIVNMVVNKLKKY